jgi:integrase
MSNHLSQSSRRHGEIASMVDVKLRGLKIARARGKYYVYRRSDGECLLKGFAGDKDALRKRLEQPDMLGLYNTGRPRAAAYAEKSLGWLVAWFTDPAQCEHFRNKLSDVTRDEYKDRLGFLEPVYDTPLASISSPDVYAARDRASKEKWPAYADKMVSALSTMFTLAVQRGWMLTNPAADIKKAYKPDPNANREWSPAEWRVVMERASLALKITYMIARHLGYRSQSTVAVKWSNYQPDERFGMCFRMAHRKNNEGQHWLPASPELQDFLAALPQTKDGHIALRRNGKPWESAEQLQKQSSNFLTNLARKGLVGPGLTEHGLRVTFAAEIKRVTGANDDQVAAALGDRDARMGGHYTRHVEQEARIIQVFFGRFVGTRTERVLENGPAQTGKRHGSRTKTPRGIKRLTAPPTKKGGP